LSEIIEKHSTQELSDLLDETHPRVLLRAVADEDNADIAIFLLKLQQISKNLEAHAAQILAQLSLDKQVAVAEKIAVTEVDDSERVEEIYTRIVDRIMTITNRTTIFGDGTSNLAKLMSHMPLGDQDRLLESLEQKQPNLVNDINQQIFTFDDLKNLNDDALRTILQMLDPSTVALALHKTAPEIQEKFLRNLSPESAIGVEKEMDALTFEQMQIADTARQSVVSMVRRFAVKGIITIDEEDDTSTTPA